MIYEYKCRVEECQEIFAIDCHPDEMNTEVACPVCCSLESATRYFCKDNLPTMKVYHSEWSKQITIDKDDTHFND